MALAMWWLPPLLLLIAGGVALVTVMRGKRMSDPAAIPVANSQRLTSLPGYRRAHQRAWQRSIVASLALLLLLSLLAFTSGRWIWQRVVTPEKFSRDIVLCLDVSGSMIEFDERVIARYREMLPEFEGERISLVLWDSSAVPVFPLTDDYEFVDEQLQIVEESMRTEGGSGSEYSAGTRNGAGASLVGDGLASCAIMFGPAADDGRSRSIIFATDNIVNGNELVSLDDAAKIAAERKITIYALDTNDRDNAFADELRTTVESVGGRYYELSEGGSVRGIVDQITSEQTSVIKGAPMVLITDRPAGWLIATLVSLVGWLALARWARL